MYLCTTKHTMSVVQARIHGLKNGGWIMVSARNEAPSGVRCGEGVSPPHGRRGLFWAPYELSVLPRLWLVKPTIASCVKKWGDFCMTVPSAWNLVGHVPCPSLVDTPLLSCRFNKHASINCVTVWRECVAGLGHIQESEHWTARTINRIRSRNALYRAWLQQRVNKYSSI